MNHVEKKKFSMLAIHDFVVWAFSIVVQALIAKMTLIIEIDTGNKKFDIVSDQKNIFAWTNWISYFLHHWSRLNWRYVLLSPHRVRRKKLPYNPKCDLS